MTLIRSPSFCRKRWCSAGTGFTATICCIFSLTKSISSFNHACSDNAMAAITPLNPGLEKNENTNLPQRACFQISAVIASIMQVYSSRIRLGHIVCIQVAGGQKIGLIELSQSGEWTRLLLTLWPGESYKARTHGGADCVLLKDTRRGRTADGAIQ